MDAAQRLLIAQLLATRDAQLALVSQIDATLLTLGVDVDRLGEITPADCPHPPEEVVNHHDTLDDAPDDYECKLCGARQSEPFH